MLFCCEELANEEGENQTANTNSNLIVCGFEVCSHVLDFIVIGQYTINISEIFQVFMVFGLWQ